MTTSNQSDESKAAAKEIGLRYVNPKSPGFRRVGKNKYVNAQGRAVRDAKTLERFRKLVIPPAWKNVWICPYENGHLQVTGEDAAGRKQYRYHADWTKSRNETKFTKIITFAKKLPEIRRKVSRDLRLDGMGREKVLATVVRIMEQTMIRVGNDEYAEKNKSYGLTTIRNHHVKVKGSKISFKFKGKSGKEHDLEIEDKYLAKIVRHCQDLPGQELFAYKNEKGETIDVNSQDVNDYLKEVTKEDISAKDFRTWGGTVQAALFLSEAEPSEKKTELKKTFLRAVEHTAEQLRNTVSVCRKYYIHPCVFESFENGSMVKISASCKKAGRHTVRGLYPEEKFALELLKQAEKQRSVQ